MHLPSRDASETVEENCAVMLCARKLCCFLVSIINISIRKKGRQHMVSQPHSSYIADASNPLEIARLLRQSRLATKHMGGLFPTEIDISPMRTFLDIGCGPGGWALDVAQHAPQKHVVGIDIEATLIDAARRYALAEATQNVTFLQMDARQPLAFADETFDFIQIRFAQTFLNRDTWGALLRECFRIVSPNGVLSVTDYEFSVSTSEANDKLGDLLCQALWKTNRTFSQTGHSYGVAPILRHLLSGLGFVSLCPYAYVFDISSQTEDFRDWFENFIVMNRSFSPFLVQSGLISKHELDVLLDQAIHEITREHYCSTVFVISWVARKPGTPDRVPMHPLSKER